MSYYQDFASLYDPLMQDAPYEKWLAFIDRVVSAYDHSITHIVDLGCGTGSLSLPLAQKGFKVTGIDLSEDMLTIAQNKAYANGVQVQFVQQNMAELSLPEQVDTVICFCDSLNYLTEERAIQNTFQAVFDHLQPNGLFLFDCHSLYKLQHIFGNQMFGSTEEELSYIWQCDYDDETREVEHHLSFFLLHEDGRYSRVDELHVQKGYTQAELTHWLEESGFKLLEITADFSSEPPTAECERLFFVAQKMGS